MTLSGGHIPREVLSSLVDGECGVADRREAHEHLQTCPDCRRCMKEFTAVQSMVADLPPLVAPRSVVEAALVQSTRTVISVRRKLVLAATAAAALITLGGLAAPAERDQPPVDAFVSRHVSVNAGNMGSGEVLFAVTGR